MKLVQAEIFDFKSIKHDKLDIKSNQLCFVGKNECGKSSIIQAIRCLDIYQVELSTNEVNKESTNYPHGFPIVSGVFELRAPEYERFLNVLMPDGNPSGLEGFPRKCDLSYLQLKRWGNGVANLSVDFTDKQTFRFELLSLLRDKASFLDNFFKEICPIIEYYENEELLIEPATVDDLIGNDRRYETFRRLLYLGGCEDLEILANEDHNFVSTFQARIAERLNVILRKHYRQDESISVSLMSIRGDRLNLVVKDSSGQTFSIDERSPGFRYYFSFLINKLWTKQKNNARNTILLLDEPGGNLHPNGAKDLLRTFEEVAESSQILYTTHNPFLTIRNDMESLVFVSKTPAGGTKTHRKPYLNKYQILRKELGILLNDSFLIGDINLVVEGSTEKVAFHRLFQLEKYRELEWLNVYDAGGVTNMSQALNYLGPKNLNLAGIAFLDSDPEAETEKTKSGFLNAMKEKRWDFLEVNSAFREKKTRTFEDLFPQKFYVEAFNSYCRLLDVDTFNKPFVDFPSDKPVDTPIIKKVQDHYLSFIEESRRAKSSITKQMVIGILFDSLDVMEVKDRDKALENVFKIADGLKSKLKEVEKHVGQ